MCPLSVSFILSGLVCKRAFRPDQNRRTLVPKLKGCQSRIAISGRQKTKLKHKTGWMQLGGLELPRTTVHYVLSVTRLPFRHSCSSTSWIRTSVNVSQRIYNPTPLTTQSSCYKNAQIKNFCVYKFFTYHKKWPESSFHSVLYSVWTENFCLGTFILVCLVTRIRSRGDLASARQTESRQCL